MNFAYGESFHNWFVLPLLRSCIANCVGLHFLHLFPGYPSVSAWPVGFHLLCLLPMDGVHLVWRAHRLHLSSVAWPGVPDTPCCLVCGQWKTEDDCPLSISHLHWTKPEDWLFFYWFRKSLSPEVAGLAAGWWTIRVCWLLPCILLVSSSSLGCMSEPSCLHRYPKSLFIMNLQLNVKCFSPVTWCKIRLDGKTQNRCCFTENISVAFISAFTVRMRTVVENRIAAGVLLTFMDKIFCKIMNIYFSCMD